MKIKNVRFVNILNPEYLGGSVYAITQKHLFVDKEQSEKTTDNGIASGRLIQSSIKIEWITGNDNHIYFVPQGSIVRFVNIKKFCTPNFTKYLAAQTGLYKTAADAIKNANINIIKDSLIYGEDFNEYEAIAVPIIFEAPDSFVKFQNRKINYDVIHCEELAF